MRIALALALVALTAGCVREPKYVSDGTVDRIATGTLPPPEPIDLAASKRPYLVGPFDKLSIEVFGVEELTRQVVADASGRFSMPLIGVVEASGKSTSQLSTEIEARLRTSYVRKPQVTVNLVETVGQVVTVEGQVNQPGLYPVLGDMTLLRAIATAKGTTEFAKAENVMVFRTVNGQRMVALYDLRAIRRGFYGDPEIYANDIVVVDDSKARHLFKDLVQVAPLAAPLIYLFR